MQFKEGQKIIMKEDCIGFKKGEIYELHECGGCLYVGVYSVLDCTCQEKWLPYQEQKTFATLEVGDGVEQNYGGIGEKYKIIDFSLNKKLVYIETYGWYNEEAFNHSFTIPSSKITLSKKDIAEKFGVDEDNLEIK